MNKSEKGREAQLGMGSERISEGPDEPQAVKVTIFGLGVVLLHPRTSTPGLLGSARGAPEQSEELKRV